MSAATEHDNPFVWALTNLVASYDDTTQQVSLLAMREARRVLHLAAPTTEET